MKKIKTWAENGNTIISIGSGSKFLIDKNIVDESLLEKEESDEINYLAYGDAEKTEVRRTDWGCYIKFNNRSNSSISFWL